MSYGGVRRALYSPWSCPCFVTLIKQSGDGARSRDNRPNATCANGTESRARPCGQATRHRPGFVQKPNYLTLLTSIFFFFRQQFFFLNSSSLSTNRKQTVYNRSNPYSTKHSQGKNEHFRFFFPSPSSPPLPRAASACARTARGAPSPPC